MLVMAQKNKNVDNIALSFLKFGSKIIRFGKAETNDGGEKSSPDLWEYTLAGLRAEREMQCMSAECICCTTAGTGAFALHGISFAHMLIEECAQATKLEFCRHWRKERRCLPW